MRATPPRTMAGRRPYLPRIHPALRHARPEIRTRSHPADKGYCPRMGEAIATATLTAGQQARRQRVMTAALELAADGGYDVGPDAGRVQQSRRRPRHDLPLLLLEGSPAWPRPWPISPPACTTRSPTFRPRARPRPTGLSTSTGDATRALERQPSLTAALITALSSPDNGVNENASLVRSHIGRHGAGDPGRPRPATSATTSSACSATSSTRRSPPGPTAATPSPTSCANSKSHPPPRLTCSRGDCPALFPRNRP